MQATAPKFLDSGEGALVVEFGREVDPDVNARVMALDAALDAEKVTGVVELVPTYRSLMIHYDPLVLPRAALIARIEGLAAALRTEAKPRTRWVLPVCYDGECGEDVGVIADWAKLTPEQVIALHSSAIYRVYMYGFAPGWCYLGGLPKELGISRRATPRPPIPPNTIIIAGGLSLVATNSMPTGWWLIGRTAERMMRLDRDPVFLAEPGDELRFERVDRATFDSLDARAAAGVTVSLKEAAS
jgi:inhibitor of KinA